MLQAKLNEIKYALSAGLSDGMIIERKESWHIYDGR